MKTIDNPEEFRTNIRIQLKNMLEGNENDALNMERGVFNYALKEAKQRKVVKKWDNPFFVQIYFDHLKTVWVNLPFVLEQIKNKEIQPHMVAFMTHQEFNPSKWEEMIQAKSKRDQSKFENRMEASTDTFTCRKCRSKKCTYYALQTRSSDEPMTIFVTCIDCGNRFKC